MLTVPFPPLVDYPNHLAEGFILAHIGDSPRLQANYQTVFAPFPNLAATLTLPLLMQALPPLAAGKALLTLILLLWVAGAHLFARAVVGRSSWLAVPIALMAYNSSFYYGFLNYAMSVPIFLIAFAAWLSWRSSMGPGRFLLLTLLACLCYLGHFSAYAFLGLGCATTLAVEALSARRLPRSRLLALLPLLPPVALFLTYMGGSGEVGGVIWGDPVEKSISFLSPLIGYDRRVDAAVLLLTAAALLLVWRAAYGRTLRRPILACGLAFAAAVFATPRVILTSSGADIRFALPALICLLLAADLRLPRPAARAGFALLVAALCLKLFGLWGSWTEQSREIACSVRALATVEEGARILPITLRSTDPTEDKRQRGLIHSAHYATVLREALVPSLFTYASQQIVRLKGPSTGRIAALSETADPASVDWTAIQDGYDYLWAGRFTPAFAAQAGRIAGKARECPQGALWRIRRAAPS